MFEWLKKKIVLPPIIPVSSQKITANKAAVRYNSNLISELVKEHEALLKVYTKMLSAIETKNFSSIAQYLKEFDQGLRTHLLREHVELYVYLEYILSKRTRAFQEMHNLRLEMDHISTEVITFLNVHQAAPVNEKTIAQFEHDFIQIGEVLVGRIQREENSLYTLYQPD